MAQTAVKTEPQGEWLSESEIAKRVKLHRQTVAARLEDLGYEPDDERSNAKLKVYWFDDEMEFAIKAAKDSLTAIKIREMRARAEKIEMQNARERGELVPMAEAVEIVQKVVLGMYKEFHDRQPKRLGKRLAQAKNVQAVTKALKMDTARIMKIMRNDFEGFVELGK